MLAVPAGALLFVALHLPLNVFHQSAVSLRSDARQQQFREQHHRSRLGRRTGRNCWPAVGSFLAVLNSHSLLAVERSPISTGFMLSLPEGSSTAGPPREQISCLLLDGLYKMDECRNACALQTSREFEWGWCEISQNRTVSFLCEVAHHLSMC